MDLVRGYYPVSTYKGWKMRNRLLSGFSTSDQEVPSEVNTLFEFDFSLDLEFQEAANPELLTVQESDASGMLDSDEDLADAALKLARAYLDMDDKMGAKEFLETAISMGSMGDDAQVEIAKQLLVSIE